MSDENQIPENEGSTDPNSESVTPEEKPKPRRGRPPRAKAEDTLPTREELEEHVPEPEPESITVGRIVHYVTRSKTIRPAIVVGVDFDTETIEVVVFNSTGGQYVESVTEGEGVGQAYLPTR